MHQLYRSTIVLVFTMLLSTSRAFINKRTVLSKTLGLKAVSSLVECELPPKLEKVCSALVSVPDDKVRYQQLLYLAGKAKVMPPELKTEATKVPGCLSVVHVHATLGEDGTVSYQGDSDSQLTKGIVTLLVNGLTGSTPEQIQKVKPEFIQFAGIGASLTPGRNNGFLNMLKKMKDQAREFSTSSTTSEYQGSGPVYNSIMKKLALMKPDELVLVDESSKHAGHSGMKGITATETHFNLKIVAECFTGLGLVQRHKMIYALLDDELKNKGLHALSIVAKTPAEMIVK